VRTQTTFTKFGTERESQVRTLVPNFTVVSFKMWVFYCLMIKKRVTTQCITVSETANIVQSKYFRIKFISYVL